MNDQVVLFGLAVPPEVRLTARQRFALELIAERPRSFEELGAALHQRKEVHGAGRTCRWCRAEGSALGARLRQFGLVKFSRRSNVWYLRETGLPKDRTSVGQSDDIPF